MWIVATIHGYECCRWTVAVWKHSNEDEIGVVDPVKCWIGCTGDASGREQRETARGGGEVGVEWVIDVL